MAIDTSRARFLSGVQRVDRVGRALEDDYVSGITGFDPASAFQGYAQGAFNQFRRDFSDNLSRLRASQVGMGRINTGFATQDEDRLFTEMGSRLNDALLQGSMQAAGMDLQRLGQMGDYAQRARETALEGHFGDWATRYQQEQANKASKRSMWGSLGGALLGAAGTVLGGAGGAALFASDERLKQGAAPIEGALSAVREIPGQTWEWNEAGRALGMQGPGAGVMAQDVARVAPEAVAQDPATGVLGVNYGGEPSVTGLLTEAVRELDAKVGMLEQALLGILQPQAPAAASAMPGAMSGAMPAMV